MVIGCTGMVCIGKACETQQQTGGEQNGLR
jgi:hypothetical protein